MNLLIEWLIEGVALAAMATLIVRLVPASSPAQRHLVWWLALLCVLALPWAPNVTTLGTAATTLLGGGAAADDSLLEIPAPPSWVLSFALAAWGLAALVSLVRLGVNLRAVGRLADAATPLDSTRAARLVQFSAARRTSRDARVLVSANIRGACAIGWRRPRIILSADLVATLDDDAIEAIVLHEYAHLQRFDDWTRLVQCVLRSVTALHPAVRWISRQIDVEREMACDRLVVQRTGSPVTYARALARAAEISGRMSGLTPFAVPGASMSGAGLHARVSRLLAWRIASRQIAWAAALAGAALLSLTVAFLGAMPPVVVVESIQLPLRALASMPIRSGAHRQLPGGSRAVLQRDASDAQSTREPRRDSLVDASPVQVASERAPVSDSQATMVSAAGAPASLPGEHASEVLASTSLLPVSTSLAPVSDSLVQGDTFLPPVPHSRVPERRPDPVPAGAIAPDIGTSASRIGVATAAVASRAGMSVGRFFKNGGLAVANRF